MRVTIGAILVLGLATAGCVTTEETNLAMQGRWIGQPSDAFFSTYGPPISSFPMNDGGKIYTWRGGETSRTISPTYRPMTEQERLAQQNAPRTVIAIGGNVNMNSAPPGQVLVNPGRVEQLACEAQITVDPAGIITNVRATRDTDGEGLSFSRCGEVFGVGS